VARCAQLLQNAGASIGGIVLNMLSGRRGRGYDYYGTYYAHRHYRGAMNSRQMANSEW
jgi:Mrp family chromosome partitioning ATPase